MKKSLVNPKNMIKLLHNLNDANLIINLLSLTITLIFISYWHHLEISKCSCGLSKEEEYIKYSLYVILGLNIIGLFAPDFLLSNYNNYIGKFISIIVMVWGATYYVSLGNWLYKMHKNKCKCVDDWRKTFMEILYFGWIIIYFGLAVVIMKLQQ